MIGESPSAIEKKFLEMSQKVVEETGYDLYDIEYIKSNKTLRVYIADKETGSALIEDCVAVDRGFTEHVEAADWVPEDFVLEVSSPGVYRKLKTEKHFESAIDEIIYVETLSPVVVDTLSKKGKGVKKFRALLKDYTDKKLILDADGTQFELELSQVKKANLDPDL
ncbi:MAG: ribosome maturation factor RimP [Bacteriovoracaceae bacterium]|nr:ribosome maturation factor RimP [Bacteriovoracaceae bacterium]